MTITPSSKAVAPVSTAPGSRTRGVATPATRKQRLVFEHQVPTGGGAGSSAPIVEEDVQETTTALAPLNASELQELREFDTALRVVYKGDLLRQRIKRALDNGVDIPERINVLSTRLASQSRVWARVSGGDFPPLAPLVDTEANGLEMEMPSHTRVRPESRVCARVDEDDSPSLAPLVATEAVGSEMEMPSHTRVRQAVSW